MKANNIASNSSNVLIPIIRRCVPNIIINQLLGVQPMTGPVGQVLAMRYRYSYGKYSRVFITNGQYNKFVRLYNRKRHQLVKDIENAGYPSFILYDSSLLDECIIWCDTVLGSNNYIRDYCTFFFLTLNDKISFSMVWK